MSILDKWTFNTLDYEIIQWHDIKIHAVYFNNKDFELLFDIDFIYNWISPLENEKYFKFNIAPATLVFEKVSDVKFDLEFELDLAIDELKTSFSKLNENQGVFNWLISSMAGEISFNASGFNIYIRKESVLSVYQSLSLSERQGINFDKFVRFN